MKTLALSLLAFLLAALPAAHASTPAKAPIVKYTGLWTNSPFTSKPPPPPPGETVNPFEDFTLTGIAPVPGGYHITIMSKKNPDVKKVIAPGVASEFKVVSVNRNPNQALGTTVVLSSGSIQGTVAFEPELITLKAAPLPQQANPNLPPGVNNPNLPPGVNPPPVPGQNNDAQSAPRPPRARIVPPPTAGANPQPQIQGQRNDDRRDPRRR